ncbi:MAG: hypothetical protein ACRDHJ_02365 [Actinomycetota bacterium]
MRWSRYEHQPDLENAHTLASSWQPDTPAVAFGILKSETLALARRQGFWSAVEQVAELLHGETTIVQSQVSRIVEATMCIEAEPAGPPTLIRTHRLRKLQRASRKLVEELEGLLRSVTPPPPRPELTLVETSRRR